MPAEPPIPPAPPEPGSKKTTADLKWPDPGTTTADEKMRFEADLLAYHALSMVCHQIQVRVSKPVTDSSCGKPVHLILLDAASMTAFDVEAAFQAQTDNLKSAFESAAGQANSELPKAEPGRALPQAVAPTDEEKAALLAVMPSTAAAAAPAAMSAALGLVKLLQGDTAYSGRATTIQPRALSLELAHQWEGDALVSVHIPDFSLRPVRDAGAGDLQTRLDAVMDARRQAYQAIHALSESTRALKPENPKYAPAMFALNSAKEQFESADSVLRQLSTRLGTAGAAGDVTPLQLLNRAAWFRKLMQAEGTVTLFLFAEAVIAGGSYRTVKNVFRSLFWADGLDVASGVLASYGLFAAGGRLLSSGLVSSGKGFIAVRDLWNGPPAPLRNAFGRIAKWISYSRHVVWTVLVLGR